MSFTCDECLSNRWAMDPGEGLRQSIIPEDGDVTSPDSAPTFCLMVTLWVCGIPLLVIGLLIVAIMDR